MTNSEPQHNAPTLQAAQQQRAQATQAARWLRSLWASPGDQAPPFTWDTLSLVPAWAQQTPEALQQLALLTGSLFAAPTLRLCLDAELLMRVRELIGSAALELVLLRGAQLKHEPPEWPRDPSSERNTLYSWGAVLLSTSVDDPLLQTSLIRAFSLSPALLRHGLPPTSLAQQLTRAAQDITLETRANEVSACTTP
jgi:hypothetical protein